MQHLVELLSKNQALGHDEQPFHDPATIAQGRGTLGRELGFADFRSPFQPLLKRGVKGAQLPPRDFAWPVKVQAAHPRMRVPERSIFPAQLTATLKLPTERYLVLPREQLSRNASTLRFANPVLPQDQSVGAQCLRKARHLLDTRRPSAALASRTLASNDRQQALHVARTLRHTFGLARYLDKWRPPLPAARYIHAQQLNQVRRNERSEHIPLHNLQQHWLPLGTNARRQAYG